MLYPIGTQDFETIINRKMAYVDKTDLVYELAQQRVCFLSRPRRFGKSLLISTLDAYFSGKKDLFKGLKMEALEQDWVEYPVFRVDFASGDFSKEGFLDDRLEEYVSSWECLYETSNIYTTKTSHTKKVH